MERHASLSEIMDPKEKSWDQKSSLKLKPIQIPKFSGPIKHWPTFCGLFKTMVIDEKSYIDIQRMQFLKTSITGEAAKLVSTAENFKEAWAILVNRYENKRAIRDSHIEMLLEIPIVTKETSMHLRGIRQKQRVL